jgi:hypothetical protein
MAELSRFTVRQAFVVRLRSGFVKLTSTAPAGGPYKDTAVTAGAYCYYVTATVNGTESVPSNSVNPSVPTAPPTNLVNVVVK